MNKVIEFLLRSVMAIIFAIAAIISAIVTGPFALIFWVAKILKNTTKNPE